MLSLLSKILNSLHVGYTPPTETKSNTSETLHKALIGDIGGTNIRLRLISFTRTSKIPFIIKASENMKTNSFHSF